MKASHHYNFTITETWATVTMLKRRVTMPIRQKHLSLRLSLFLLLSGSKQTVGKAQNSTRSFLETILRLMRSQSSKRQMKEI